MVLRGGESQGCRGAEQEMGDFDVGAGGGKDKLGGIVTSFYWPGE